MPVAAAHLGGARSAAAGPMCRPGARGSAYVRYPYTLGVAMTKTVPARGRAARAAKSQRIEVRATERQEALLRDAASATERTMTDFILESAVDQAERVLADRRWFVATPEQYDAFLEALDEPLVSTAKLDELWSRSSPFGEQFTPATR